MDKKIFDDYIARFNAEDRTAFDDYIHPDLHMINGTLEFHGVQGMRDHYAAIWAGFVEQLAVERFVSDEQTIAIHMKTHFIARDDNPESLFGPVLAGETFDFDGLIMYQVENGKFAEIRVAYHSFVYTNADGERTSLGIPH